MSARAVFAALVPVFLLILSGVAAKRWLVPDEDHWIGAERLVYYVLFPALLIHTLARADLGAEGLVLRFMLALSIRPARVCAGPGEDASCKNRCRRIRSRL